MKDENLVNYLLLDYDNKVCGKIILIDGNFSLVESDIRLNPLYWSKTEILKNYTLYDKLKDNKFYYYHWTNDLLLRFKLVKENAKILSNE